MSKVRILSNLLDSSNDVAVSYLDNVTPYTKPSSEPISYISGLQSTLDAKTTSSYVDSKVAALVASAPATLDTLNELAAALGDDANHVTTMTNLVATKQSASGDYDVGDNVKINLGNSDDLQIYHDGTNSRIWDVGVGGLFILASNSLTLGDAQGYDFITCTDEGAGGTVRLNHQSNATKLATTSSGIDVTGTVTADAGSYATTLSGNTLTFDRNGDSTIQANGGTSANLSINADKRIFLSAKDYLEIKTGATPTTRLKITSTGNVGIGTTSPLYNLDLLASNAVSMIRTNDTTSPTLGLFVNSGANGVGTISVDNGGHMTFDTGSTGAGQAERMRITSTGVGIGTSSPSNRLHVATGDSANDNYRTGADTPLIVEGTTASYLQFVADANAPMGIFMGDASDSAVGGVTYDANGGGILIKSGGYNRMTISSTGNVGIGTSSPSSSSGYANLTLDGSNSGWVELRSGGAAVADWYSSGGNEVTFRALQQGMNLTVGGANNSFKVATNGSERLRIDYKGNMGLGVTPESWNTAYSALQIGGISALYANSGTTAGRDLYLVNNVYHTTGGTEAYIIADEATLYKQQNGTHEFKVAPSGTADSAISWTTALTIGNTGNVEMSGNLDIMSNNSPHISIQQGFTGFAFKWYSDWSDSYFRNASGGHNLLRLSGNGDIGFYDTNGSTTPFLWDASAKSLSLSGKNVPKVFNQNAAPTSGFSVGDIWYDDDDDIISIAGNISGTLQWIGV